MPWIEESSDFFFFFFFQFLTRQFIWTKILLKGILQSFEERNKSFRLGVHTADEVYLLLTTNDPQDLGHVSNQVFVKEKQNPPEVDRNG